MNRKVRVRFAPSPTGPLHMGGVRTALYNYLFAKQNNGDFILRIEDTDQNRFVPGAEEYIIEALKWSGIVPNEGVGFGDGPYAPYRQSERKSVYGKYIEQLISTGKAYYAFDTEEELIGYRLKREALGSAFAYDSTTRYTLKNSLTLSVQDTTKLIKDKSPYVVRLKVPEDENIILNDIIRGQVIVHSSQLDDKVLFKSDGMPTYHLANVVDDYLMDISHVIRGEEWLPSAPLHVLLYRSFGWENKMPQFAHLPLILKPDGKGKLSKRDGDRLGFPVFPINWKDPVTGEISSGYKEKGYYSSAFINMLALLGWHPSDDRELFSMEELVKAFSLEKISKSGAKFDPNKTKWFNEQYLRLQPNIEIANRLRMDLQKELKINSTDPRLSDQFLLNVVHLMKDRVHFEDEIIRSGPPFTMEILNVEMNSPTELQFDIFMHAEEKINIRTVQIGIQVDPPFISNEPVNIDIIKKHEKMISGSAKNWDMKNNLIRISVNTGVDSNSPIVVGKEPVLIYTIKITFPTIFNGGKPQLSFNLLSTGGRFTTAVTEWIGNSNMNRTITNSGTYKGSENTVFGNKINYLYSRPIAYDNDVIQKRWKADYFLFFKELINRFKLSESFSAEAVELVFNDTAVSMNLKPKELLQLLRVLISGEGGGVHLFGMIELLGKNEVVARIEKALNTLQSHA